MSIRAKRVQFATPGLPPRMQNFRFFAVPAGDGATGAPAPKVTEPANDGEDFKSEHSKKTVLSDLAKERDARKALEQTIADMQKSQKDQMSAIAAAFGVKEESAGADGSQLLGTLQSQVAQMQHEALVYRVAAERKLTDAADIDFLKSAKDEDAMGKLADRLASQPSGTPKPDLTQGPKGEPVKPEPLPGVARIAQAFDEELSSK